MRADAASLLARLGHRDFRYREFSDSFADMELWPIFEALLTDPRVVGKPLTKLEAREAEVLATRRVEHDRPSPQQSGTVTSMFDAYAQGEGASSNPPKGNLRDFLGHLSQSSPKRDY